MHKDATEIGDHLLQYFEKRDEAQRLKKELQKHLSLISDKITKIKLSEAIKQIETLKKGQVVTEKQVLNLMRYYELVKEIKNVHK